MDSAKLLEGQTAQVNQAVQALNLMHTGNISKDLSLLENKTEEQFRAVVGEIVGRQPAQPDASAVELLIKTLLPLVSELRDGASEAAVVSGLVSAAISKAVVQEDSAAAAPSAMPTLPARPVAAAAAAAGGSAMPSLPVRSTPAAAAASSAMPTLPARPTPSAPAATTGSAMPSLPTRPAAASAVPAAGSVAAQQQAQAATTAATAASSAAPTLPARPAAAAAAATPAQGGTVIRPVVSALSPAPGAARQQNPQPAAPAAPMTPEQEATSKKLQEIRVKLLRLSRRLGQGPRNTVVAQVLYRLELAEHLKAGRPRGMPGGNSAAFEAANAEAIKAEEEPTSAAPLGFECTILVLGKTGVGKTSTIYSIFDDPPADAGPFDGATPQVREIKGTVYGIPVRIIDTPGLRPCAADSRYNARIMAETKKFMKKHSPDIVLYFDRLDMPHRDFGDLPLLRIVTETFGASIWFNAIVVLTHACAAPPDGANGAPISYDMYVAQRSHVVQQMIRQAAGDMRLMNPVSLAENHPECRQNNKGERVLPNGQVWRPQLLLLAFASKILTEANSLLNLKENSAGRQFQAMKQKTPPLPYLLSSLLTARKPRKPMEAEDDEEMYEAPPPSADEDLGPPPKQVAIPAPDPALPPSFDSDNPGHRFRFLESANQWMVRPIVEAHGWDHDAGVEGFSVDKALSIKPSIPANMSGQVTKEKKDMQLALEAEASAHHKTGLVSTAGVEVQTVGRQLAYTCRTETRWKNAASNKTSAGLSASMVGKGIAYGAKIEDRWKIRPGMKLVLSGGAITSKGDVAYGGNMEATLRKITDESAEGGRTTIGASFMNWKGDLALGANLTNQFAIEPKTQLTTRANINSRGAGQLSVRASTNDRLQLALASLVPVVCTIIGRIQQE